MSVVRRSKGIRRFENYGETEEIQINEKTNGMMKRFVQIFKNDNDWNEKTIIGFMSFAVMVLVMIIDIFTDISINEFIYNSFLIVTLGSFGIAGLEKFASIKK
jgi:hypothetical protein